MTYLSVAYLSVFVAALLTMCGWNECAFYLVCVPEMIAWVNETKHSNIIRVPNHLMAKDCGDSLFISTNECCSTQPNYVCSSFAIFSLLISFCFCFRFFLSKRYTLRYDTVPCLRANRLTFHWCTQCAHNTSFEPCSFISYWKRKFTLPAVFSMHAKKYASAVGNRFGGSASRHTIPFYFKSFYATSKFIPTTINFVSSAKRLSDPL